MTCRYRLQICMYDYSYHMAVASSPADLVLARLVFMVLFGMNNTFGFGLSCISPRPQQLAVSLIPWHRTISPKRYISQ